MFNNVDLIGVEAVVNVLEQTQLKRFIIYRHGAAKGSTPVFDCSHTITNHSAVKSFKDWAFNITQYNPNNFLSYEMLAFNDYDEGEASPNELNGQIGKKKGKMRITFALNAPQNNFGFNMPAQSHAPAIDIQAEIQKGIEAALLKKELEELRRFKKEVEEQEEEEEEEEKMDIIDKVAGILNTFKEHENAAQINGGTVMNEDVTIKNQNINKAIKTLYKHNKNLDKDLMKLADLAENEPLIFKMVLEKLRSF